jgi:hypothetical protein
MRRVSMVRMARRKISNERCAALDPLIPVFEPSPKGDRRRSVDDRAVLNTYVEYVLFADDLVVLIDAHPRQAWLLGTESKRLREEFAKL